MASLKFYPSSLVEKPPRSRPSSGPGRLLHELELGDDHDAVLDAYRNCVAPCATHHLTGCITRATDGRRIEFQKIIAPLSADGETVNMLPLGLTFQQLTPFKNPA